MPPCALPTRCARRAVVAVAALLALLAPWSAALAAPLGAPAVASEAGLPAEPAELPDALDALDTDDADTDSLDDGPGHHAGDGSGDSTETDGGTGLERPAEAAGAGEDPRATASYAGPRLRVVAVLASASTPAGPVVVAVLLAATAAAIFWFRRRGRHAATPPAITAVGRGPRGRGSSRVPPGRSAPPSRSSSFRRRCAGPESSPRLRRCVPRETIREGEVVRSRRSLGRLWRQAAAVTLGLAVAGSGLLAVPTRASAAPAAPAVAAAALPLAAPASLPKADILDVDAADAANPLVDHAANRTPVVKGAPTPSVDPTLKRTVAAFNGVDDMVAYNIADAWKPETQPNITQSVSLECVFRFEDTLPTTAEKDVCSGKQSGGYTIRVNGGNLQAQFHIGGAYQYAATPIQAGTWYHALATYDGATVKLYVNGALAATTPVSGAVTPPPGGWFGVGADTNATGGLEFPAKVSVAVARIYSQPLSATQANQLASAVGLGVKAPAADLLDVTFTGGAPVERTASMPATTYGAPTYAADADVRAQAMTVDGVDDAIGFAGFADRWSSMGAGFGIECVFKVPQALTATTEKDLCSSKEAGGASIFVTGTANGSEFTANLGTSVGITAAGSTTNAYKSVSTPIDTGRWYHALSVWDGANVSLYVNGVLAGTTPAVGTLTLAPNTTARHFVVGGDASPNGKVGQWSPPALFAAARVYGHAVSAGEAELLAKQWNTTPPAPKADVLDVDFADGTPVDHAQSLAVATNGDPQIAEEEALAKRAASFDGSDDSYSYAFGDQWSKLGTGFSVECTFRLDRALPLTTENAFCSDKESGGLATVANGDKITFMAYIGGAYKSVSATMRSGQWYHTLATWDGATLKLYVDGKLASSVAATGSLGLPSGNARTAFAIGSDVNASAVPQFFAAGAVATAKVYSRALTAVDALGLNVAALGEVRDAAVRLVSTTPARGARLTRAVEFAPVIEHQGSATGWTYLLDGRPIKPGDSIGGGLAAGDHRISIAATDVFGKALSWDVPFTSTAIPTGGGAQSGQGSGRVTLSAVATAPDGSDVTTTFKQAAATPAQGGFQGVVPVLPTALDFTYTEGEQLTGTFAPDETVVDSRSTGQIPFQRFDVPMASVKDGQEIVWTGVVDPERSVTLRVWSTAAKAWVTLGSARGSAEGDTTLSGAVRPAFLDKGAVHVLVTGEDPFADDLSPHDASASTDKDAFEKPEDYDFSLAHFTDTQYLAEGAAGGTYNDWDGTDEPSDVMTAEEQAIWQRAYRAETEWIRDNAQLRKIRYTAHTGDVIENDYYDPLTKDANGNLRYPGLDAEVDRELAFTSSAQKVLDDAGVVNQVIAGNHDNQLGNETGPDSRFSRTFSADRYYEAAKKWPAEQKASFHAWDETLDNAGNIVTPGRDSQNNYVLFSAGGLDFVAVGLSYGVTQQEAEWASSIFARYHDRNGILLTHAYLAPSTAPDGRGAGFSTDGSRLYQQVVTANPNVFLVLAGHEHGVGTNLKREVGVTVAHNVVELLADYQFYTVSAGELFPGKADAQGNIDLNGDGKADRKATDQLQFGASFLRLLQFDVDRSEMSIDTYSPHLKNFGATEYDDRHRYNGAEDNLRLPVDLSSRVTSFGTDGLTLVTPGETVIGEATARSGWPATVTWSGLVKGQVYAWTATSRDASGEEIGSVDQFGGIFIATDAGTDVTPPVLTLPTGADTLTVGDSFDPMHRVKAVDAADGDVSRNVQVIGSVDTSKTGSYALTYVAADANGNQTVVARAVTVKPVPAPVLKATSVDSSNATVTFGQPLTLTASVSPAAATGTVTFISGEEIWCTATLSGGRASCTPATLPPPGTYAVRAIYTGDAAYEASQESIAVVVEEVATSIDVERVRTTYGRAVTVPVRVRGAESGSVTLRQGSRTLGEGRVVDGVARVTLAAGSLRPGAHRLTATYAGPATVSGSTTPVDVTVTRADSRTSVRARALGSGRVRVVVSVDSTVTTPTGVVKVRVGKRVREVVLQDGSATLTMVKAGSGRRAIGVHYRGDDLVAPSAATGTVVLPRTR